MNLRQYWIVIERGPHNCSAFSPDVLGCAATGSSVEQTLAGMRRALRLHLEGMIEDGDPLPRSHNLSWHLRHSDGFAPALDDLITQIEVELPVHGRVFAAA